MLAARRASPVLRLGDSRLLPSGADVLAYERSWGADRAVVAIAFDGTARLPLEGDWVVELSSDGAGEGRPFTGELAADQAVLLRPAPLGPA
jgi:alpha-glucosidase